MRIAVGVAEGLASFVTGQDYGAYGKGWMEPLSSIGWPTAFPASSLTTYMLRSNAVQRISSVCLQKTHDT